MANSLLFVSSLLSVALSGNVPEIWQFQLHQDQGKPTVFAGYYATLPDALWPPLDQSKEIKIRGLPCSKDKCCVVIGAPDGGKKEYCAKQPYQEVQNVIAKDEKGFKMRLYTNKWEGPKYFTDEEYKKVDQTKYTYWHGTNPNLVQLNGWIRYAYDSNKDITIFDVDIRNLKKDSPEAVSDVASTASWEVQSVGSSVGSGSIPQANPILSGASARRYASDNLLYGDYGYNYGYNGYQYGYSDAYQELVGLYQNAFYNGYLHGLQQKEERKSSRSRSVIHKKSNLKKKRHHQSRLLNY